MKNVKTISLVIFCVLSPALIQARNYNAPKIDVAGKITDQNGKMIGSITKEGVVRKQK